MFQSSLQTSAQERSDGRITMSSIASCVVCILVRGVICPSRVLEASEGAPWAGFLGVVSVSPSVATEPASRDGTAGRLPPIPGISVMSCVDNLQAVRTVLLEGRQKDLEGENHQAWSPCATLGSIQGAISAHSDFCTEMGWIELPQMPGIFAMSWVDILPM